MKFIQFLILFSAIASKPATAGCLNNILHFQQNQHQPDVDSSLTMKISCRGDHIHFPERTLLQAMWQDQDSGQLCYRDRTCGNIDKWGGYFSIGAHWHWYDSFSSFFVSEDYLQAVGQIKTEENAGIVNVKVALSWETIERSCSDIGPKICL